MSYDKALAARVRKQLDGVGRIEEKPMFGGLTFMLDGKMCCGVQTGRLMVRIPPERHAEFLAKPGAKPMDFTGRPMKGFLFVDAASLRTPAALSGWLREAVAHVKSAPARASRRTRKI
jgi:TfoX/Sxy family transcriptional regulator of competence genes